jgi:hypothetical protein
VPHMTASGRGTIDESERTSPKRAALPPGGISRHGGAASNRSGGRDHTAVGDIIGIPQHADVVGAINVRQGRILPEEPPKRIRQRVGKTPLEFKHAA